jgi:16S rRNA processing protein RimM
LKKLIVIGRILRPWGNKGEVKIALFSGKVERLTTFSKILIGDTEETATVVSPEKERKSKDSIFVKFSDIYSIEDAERLRGNFLFAAAEELIQPQEDEYYIDDLIGLKVIHAKQREELGCVSGILETGGTDLLEVRRGDKIILIPLTKSICKGIDMVKRTVIVDPPKGLIDLNEI